MSLKQIMILVVAAILVGGVVTFFISKSKPVVKDTIPVVFVATPTPIPAILLTWTDEAGFSFQYPNGTKIDNHPEDTTNYANLTLTFPDQSVAQIIMSDKTAINAATATFTDDDVVVTITGSYKDMITSSWQFIYPTPTISKAPKTVAPSTDNGDVLEEE